ncbi:TetR/AcrR family transcriptional regulator [Kribbella sp. NPDC050459]|uniref:TetR/AcrR family transcriptional regulator n=1 Tax=Kribbella sp. NPDC050459 TaxID=3155785 RepID=UPI0033C24BBF
MKKAAAEDMRKRGRPTGDERAARREQILDAAIDLFLESGYGGVTLDGLAAKARVTKRTIYAYVGDKAAVFEAVVSRLSQQVLPDRRSDGLEALAVRLVMTLHSDTAISLHRMVIAESAQFPELAAGFYASGPERYMARLSELIAENVPDSEATAEQLFALLLGEPHRRRLLGLEPAPTRARAEALARAAVRAMGLDH